MIIKLRQGFRVATDAETVFNAIEQVRDEHGNVTPESLFDSAKPKNSPIHSEFEWDKNTAFREYNLSIARTLLRSIEVIREEAPTAPVRAFHAVTFADPKQDGEVANARKVYRRVEDIMADPVQRDELLAQAIADLVRYRKKYANLSEFSVVFAAIDQALMEMQA